MKKDLTIQGMSCHHCVHAVRQALEGVDGVQVVEVTMGHAVVDMPAGGDAETQVRAALDEEGYPLESVQESAG